MAFSDPQKNIDQLGIAEGMRVADLGAGSGFYSLAIGKKVGKEGRVYAVDIQGGLLERLKDTASSQGIENIEVVRGDLEQAGSTHLRDTFVDVVVLANVLFQVKNKKTLVQEAFRILKPKGRLLLVDWKDSFGGIGPAPESLLLEHKARALAEEAGFSFVSEILAGEHHYGMIFKKAV